MTATVSVVPTKNRAVTVTVAASPVYLEMVSMPYPTTLVGVPGGGGTIAIAYSCSDNALSAPGSATWVAWSAGAASSATLVTLASPVRAIRMTAATATATVEMMG